LKLDDSQVAAIESMYIDVRETNGDLFRLLKGKTVDPVALSELSTKTGHLQEEFEEALLEILDPVQLRYLAGVCLRKEGILAVKYKVVAEALNVSRIQGEKIARIFRMSSLGVASAKSGKEAMEQVAAQAKKKSEDIKQVLSPEQLKDVSDLAGAK
jgi:hypothetical protein